MAKRPRSEPDEFDADDDESALDNDPDEDDDFADFDEDGLVDADDVLILLSHFGESCP